jgi:predicted  nucleic acid-binding Zn-ribbon protein
MILSRSRAEATEQISLLSDELETLRTAHEEAPRRIVELEEHIAKLEKDLNGVARELADRELDKTRLRETLKALEEEKNTLQERNSVLEQSERTAREELENLRSELEPASEERERLQLLVSDLQSQLGVAMGARIPTEDFHQLEARLGDLEAEKQALEENSRSHIEKALSLEDKLREELDRYSSLESQHRSAEEELGMAKSRLQGLESDLEQARARIAELESVPPPSLAEQDEIPSEGRQEPEGAPQGHDADPPSIVESLGDQGTDEKGLTEVEMFDSDPDTIDSIALSASESPEEIVSPDMEELFPETGGHPLESPEGEDTALEEEVLSTEESPASMVTDAAEDPSEVVGFHEMESELAAQPAQESEAEETSEDEGDPVFASFGDFDATQIFTRPEDNPEREPAGREETPPVGPSKAAEFPYPEITSAGLENYRDKHVLLVGGDERFRGDYDQLFQLAGASLVYFPGIVHLERNGMKRHIRENDIVVVFGSAVDESGLFRLRNLASDYGKRLLEHGSSGLVSLYHQLKSFGEDL